MSSKGEGDSADDTPSNLQTGYSAVTRVTRIRAEKRRTRAEVPSQGEGGTVDDSLPDSRADAEGPSTRPVMTRTSRTGVEDDARAVILSKGKGASLMIYLTR